LRGGGCVVRDVRSRSNTLLRMRGVGGCAPQPPCARPRCNISGVSLTGLRRTLVRCEAPQQHHYKRAPQQRARSAAHTDPAHERKRPIHLSKCSARLRSQAMSCLRLSLQQLVLSQKPTAWPCSKHRCAGAAAHAPRGMPARAARAHGRRREQTGRHACKRAPGFTKQRLN
jgi:hypothetical protein